MSPDRSADRFAALRPLAVDLLGVIVFVAIGRNNHDEGTAIDGIATVASPFLIALVVGWAVARLARLRPLSIGFGAVVWIVTVALGMLLRHTVFDRGTATAFIIVATVFLGFVLLGWRTIASLVMHRRAGRP